MTSSKGGRSRSSGDNSAFKAASASARQPMSSASEHILSDVVVSTMGFLATRFDRCALTFAT